MASNRTDESIKVLAEKSKAAVDLFDHTELEPEIGTTVSNASTQEGLTEEEEIFLKHQGKQICLRMHNFGPKKKSGYNLP